MFYRLLPFLLLLSSTAFPKVITKTLYQYDSVNPVKLTSHYDPATGYTLKFNGKKVYHFGDPTGGGPTLTYQSELGSEYMFRGLLSLYHGDGCPDATVVLAINMEREFVASQTVGNCEGPSRVTVTEKTLELDFAARNSPPYVAPASSFIFEGKKLREKK